MLSCKDHFGVASVVGGGEGEGGPLQTLCPQSGSKLRKAGPRFRLPVSSPIGGDRNNS